MFFTALKKAFAADKTIQKMAKEDFIMLNLLVETENKNLAPDGHYVPRILFIDPSLTVRTDIVGRYSNLAYAYEPGDMKVCELLSPLSGGWGGRLHTSPVTVKTGLAPVTY
ncbi:hypothetical protein CgunFtcFv8_024972 [Champsocephalus gunnari]|uniref:Uncharacterized protein n=1 Tax=Champsocephalus gunnari TaxID=52237 RepID=A0AAN8DNH4_CHAGU|nr:hypothetical protein CgunFtcFv8_024972 [Champsocephalus gunnari]